MSERPYSRLYWEVLEDPKFDGIREHPRHFGTWALLLVLADMAWPAPAMVPATIPRASYSVLVTAGLIDDLPGGRYRVHGLHAERERRQSAARASASARWSDRNANALPTQSERSAFALLDETRQDKTRREGTNGKVIGVRCGACQRKSTGPMTPSGDYQLCAACAAKLGATA